MLRFLTNNSVRIFRKFCYIGFLEIRIILKPKRNNHMESLFSLFFYSLISYSYLLNYIKQSGFLYNYSSFTLITDTVKFQWEASCTFYHFYFKCRIGRICRICVRIVLLPIAILSVRNTMESLISLYS